MSYRLDISKARQLTVSLNFDPLKIIEKNV